MMKEKDKWRKLGYYGAIPWNVWILHRNVDVYASIKAMAQFERWIIEIEEDEVERNVKHYTPLEMPFPKKDLIDELGRNMLSMSMWQLIVEIEAILLYWGEYCEKINSKHKYFLSLPDVYYDSDYPDEIIKDYEISEVEKVIEYLFVNYYEIYRNGIRREEREYGARVNWSDPNQIVDEMQLPNEEELRKKSDALVDTLEEYLKDKWNVIKRFRNFYIYNKIIDKGLYYFTLLFTCFAIIYFCVIGFSLNLLIINLCLACVEVAETFRFRAIKRYAVRTKDQFVNIESGAFNISIPYESHEPSLDFRGVKEKKIGQYEMYCSMSRYRLDICYIGYKENIYASQVLRLLNIDPRTEYVYLRINLLQAELVRKAKEKEYVGCVAWTILENRKLIWLLRRYGSKMNNAARQIR